MSGPEPAGGRAVPARAAAVGEFGALLRALRRGRSLTQHELAERAGLTEQAVGALERGQRRRPYPHTVRALAGALDLGPGEWRALVAAVPAPPGRAVTRDGPDVRVAAEGPPGADDPGPSTSARGERAGTFPVRVLGPVFGRDRDRERITALLRSPGRRIVTVTGPGGVGKTTLASVVVDAVRGGFSSVTHVELAGVEDAHGVLPAVAVALGLPELDGGTPDRLAAALLGRPVLLVLDDAERVLGCAVELGALVDRCPELVLFVTSRAPLRVRQEQEVRLGPLSGEAAARLFRDRLTASGWDPGPDPETVAIDRLCARADGLPLALELAATAAARLGPAALADRLGPPPQAAARDLPERQRSIAATFAWSHDLLDERARSLLARVAVFAGGFSLRDAEIVADRDDRGTEPAAALVQLVEHAFVLPVPPVGGRARFRIPEPLREEAMARLSPARLADARTALTRAVLESAADLAGRLRSAEQTTALDVLDAGVGNLWVALAQLLDTAEIDAAVDLLWSVRLHLGVRGHTHRAVPWIERLNARDMSEISRARLTTTWASLLQFTNDLSGAAAPAADALHRAERLGDHAVAAQAAVVSATGAALLGDRATSVGHLDRARHHHGHDADGWLAIHLGVASGLVALLDGRLRQADDDFRAAERACGRHGGGYDLALVLLCRALVDQQARDARRLAAQLGRAAVLAAEAMCPVLLATLVPALGGAAIEMGETPVGVRLLGAASVYDARLEILEVAGRPTALRIPTDLSRARDDLGEHGFGHEWDVGRRSDLTAVVTMARALTPAPPSTR